MTRYYAPYTDNKITQASFNVLEGDLVGKKLYVRVDKSDSVITLTDDVSQAVKFLTTADSFDFINRHNLKSFVVDSFTVDEDIIDTVVHQVEQTVEEFTEEVREVISSPKTRARRTKNTVDTEEKKS